MIKSIEFLKINGGLILIYIAAAVLLLARLHNGFKAEGTTSPEIASSYTDNPSLIMSDAVKVREDSLPKE